MTEEYKQDVQKWELLIKDRLASGMSVSQFCKANGFIEYRYYHWINEIHEADPDFDTSDTLRKAQAKTKTEKRSSLVEISPVIPKNAEIPVMEIYSGAVRIELYPNADAAFIRSLLEAVLYVQA